jgi:hypothetical protein
MTKIAGTTRIRRETQALELRRPIIVELMPAYCRIRVKWTRQTFNVSWGAVLDLGRKQAFRDAQQRRSA